MVNETPLRSRFEHLAQERRAAWIEAKRIADEAQEDARAAEDVACQRFADYAEVEQPGFAHYLRRVLNRQRKEKCDG